MVGYSGSCYVVAVGKEGRRKTLEEGAGSSSSRLGGGGLYKMQVATIRASWFYSLHSALVNHLYVI